jgi:hypothetical protein
LAISFITKAMQEKAIQSTEKDLIEVLIKNMGKYYPERSHKKVHASDVTKPDFCPRMYRILDVLGIKRPDSYINTALRATFDLGNLTADHLVEQWMGDRAVGTWVCRRCETKHMFSKRPEAKCTNGHSCDWRYEEVSFFSDAHAISGSMDLIADLGGPKFKIVELKIIKADDFEKLVAPLGEHRLRTRLYLRLIEESQNPIRFQLDTAKAKILYVSRGFGKKHPDYGQILPFKEFDIERDDESITGFLNNGLTVKTARETGTVPEAKVCDSISCTTAKGCPVRKQCWSGEIA